MVYSIVVTILLVVFIILFIRSVSNHLNEVARLENHLECTQRDNTTLNRNHREVQYEMVSLKRELEYAKQDLKNRDSLVADIRSDLRDANRKLRERHSLVGIKFTANVPHLGWTKTEFKLGLGPCGKTVTSIEFHESPEHYTLIQRCEDGERKEFEYKKEDVSGRIERAFAAVPKE